MIVDGEIAGAVCEERLNRQKLFKGFPERAIDWCLSLLGGSLADADVVAVGWNPGRHLARPDRRRTTSAWKAEYLVSIPNLLQRYGRGRGIERVEQRLVTADGATELVYVDHHMAHLANAFYLSPFERTALLSLDGVGEVDCGAMAIGGPEGIRVIRRLRYPHSLGLFYGTFTSFLGFRTDADEWKVMALASFGAERSRNPYYERIGRLIRPEDDGFFEMDLRYFSYFLQDEVGFANERLAALLGPPRAAGEELSERHHDIAAAVQWVFEDIVTHCLRTLHRLSGSLDAVGLAGGSFMNCVVNGKIERISPFARSFVSSCPDDSGISIGAALAVSALRGRPARPAGARERNDWGPGWSDDEIEATLRRYKVRYRPATDIARDAAALLAAGKLVGWYQGRMEFGQRALGDRSILADPRDPSMKDRVNRAVKYREPFRPFAPAVLERSACEWFDIPCDLRVPFMERVHAVREERRTLVPAVTHVDGSARLQTVSERVDPLFHRLIRAFEELTGVPVVLNTSFNVDGEPIVCSPADALRTFSSCGLDALAMGRYLIEK